MRGLRNRTPRRVYGALAAAALVLGLVPVAGATTLTPMSGEELTEASDLVVVGRCSAVESRWYGRSLVTRVTVTVDETLLGGSAGQVVVVLPGGIDTEREIPLAVTFPGIPQIEPGEDFLLFLERLSGTAEALYGVVGFSQGVFPLVADSEKAGGDKTMVTRGGSLRQGALPLSTVKERIRQYAARLDGER